MADVVAESMGFATSKTICVGRDAGLRHIQPLHLRGCSRGELTAAAKRTSISQKSLMVKKGWRIPLTMRMRRAMYAINMGAFDLPNADASFVFLSDFRASAIVKLGRFNIAGAKVERRGETAWNISDVTNDARRQILIFAGRYGPERGKQRNGAIDFILRLQNYPRSFIPPNFA